MLVTRLKHSVFVVLSLLALFWSYPVLAKEINLYEQPTRGSKVIGKIDLEVGIIPIDTPKNSDWMKVGDPRNGNAGWVQSNDIKNAIGATTSFSFTQKTVNESNGKNTVNVIQFGPANPADPNVQSALQKSQEQQQVIQSNMQKSAQQMLHDMQIMYQNQMKLIQENAH